MSLAHKLVNLLPAHWVQALRAESEKWLVTCLVCGTARNVWEIGGIRYKAISRGKVVGIYCPTCGRLRMMSVTKKTA